MTWAFDSLYVVVNAGTGKYPSGLYRVRDTDGDDNLDKVELLRPIDGSSEHGPHAVIPGPDGRSLYVVAGNSTKVPKLAGSLVPRDWGEDTILPRMPDGNGFMADEKAPAGYIVKVDPDGKDWTLVSMGFRNPYDIAFNKNGDLFTYDSDMEWDFNTPWYRPTRVIHAVPGGDYGYRGGSGKFPSYFYDSLPAAVDIGPGSPTGIAFGYGAKFPKKYQDALFICDWSYGKLYAVHNQGRRGVVQGRGRGVRHRLAAAADRHRGEPEGRRDVLHRRRAADDLGALSRDVRRRRGDRRRDGRRVQRLVARERQRLATFLGHRDPKAVDLAWNFLAHPDRFIRYTARAVLEFQPVDSWREKALAEMNTQASLEALLALVRFSAPTPPTATRRPCPSIRGSSRACSGRSAGSTGTGSPSRSGSTPSGSSRSSSSGRAGPSRRWPRRSSPGSTRIIRRSRPS